MSVDLGRDTIFLTLAGSHAHGTAGEGSDLDVRGVCIAPPSVRLSPFAHFEQAEGTLSGPLLDETLTRLRTHDTASAAPIERLESVIYDLGKFVTMLAGQNPNALEILFADERDWIRARPAFLRLHAERHRFLTKRLRHTYAGYAMAQLKKIKSHRSWLLDPPAAPPRRSDFGLPERSTLSADVRGRLRARIEERLASYRFDDLEMPKATRIALKDRVEALLSEALLSENATGSALSERLEAIAAGSLSLSADVVLTLEAERRYEAAVRNFQAFEQHRTRRNPARAALEAKFGYDTKHAMHLVRLYRTGLTLLETGELLVRRPDADELLAIRGGALSYEALLALTEDLEGRLDAAARASSLPEQIDLGPIEALVVELSS